MQLWKIESIDSAPGVTLESWSVYEVPLYGEDQPWARHLVGRSLEACQAQVSSPVQSFDPVRAAGITSSGRVYLLSGKPGAGHDADDAWQRWKRNAGVTRERDVTNDVFAAITSARAEPK